MDPQQRLALEVVYEALDDGKQLAPLPKWDSYSFAT